MVGDNEELKGNKDEDVAVLNDGYILFAMK